MFIAGRYTATYNALSLGQTAEGIKLAFRFFKRKIMGDAGGETRQDSVYRGAEVTADMRLIEYNAAGAQAAFWPYSATFLDLGEIGRLDVASNVAKQLIMTAVVGTTAAATPASITMPLVCLAEGFPVELLFAPDLREVPLKFDVYPGAVVSAGNSLGVFGTQT
jgi:hypothetical protein